MGNKVNPVAFRLYNSKNWKNKWFCTDKSVFASSVFDDYLVRKVVDEYYFGRPVSDVVIERYDSALNIIVKTDRVNALVGSKGSYVDELKSVISKVSLSDNVNVSIEETDTITSRYMVDLICHTLGTRGNYRRVIKRLQQQLASIPIKGYKIRLAGRLDGSEKKRTMIVKNGKLPLHTIDNKIDYSFRPAITKYGIIGVKAWICLL